MNWKFFKRNWPNLLEISQFKPKTRLFQLKMSLLLLKTSHFLSVMTVFTRNVSIFTLNLAFFSWNWPFLSPIQESGHPAQIKFLAFQSIMSFLLFYLLAFIIPHRYSMAKKFAHLTAQMKTEKRISRQLEASSLGFTTSTTLTSTTSMASNSASPRINLQR